MGSVSDPDPLVALQGDGSSPANDVLPDPGMPPVAPDNIDVDGGLVPASLPDILATVADSTTVQQLNDLLSAEDLVIAGCLSEMNPVLLYDSAIDSRTSLQARMDQLKSTEAIGKTPGSGSCGDIVEPFEEATSQKSRIEPGWRP